MADQNEQQIGAAWLRAARAWTGRTASSVTAPTRHAGTTPDPSMSLSAQGLWVEQLNANVRPAILDVIRRTWRAATGRANADPQQQYVTDYLNAAVNRMSSTPEQVYRELTGSLADGINAGESMGQLTARVQAVFDVTGNPWWENRAATVARTEAMAAVNASHLAAAADHQNRTGTRMVKTWQAHTGSPTTRPAHRAADGQTVALTAPFIVGDEALQYPGDPAGSAGNVINCRCTTSYHPATR